MNHGYEMYSIQNIVNNHIISLYGDRSGYQNQMMILKHIAISNHYVVHQDLRVLYLNYTAKTNKNKQTHRIRSDLQLTDEGVGGVGTG